MPPVKGLPPQPSRKFSPVEIYGDGVDLAMIEIPRGPWTHLACPYFPRCEYCGKPPSHIDSIIIATDGACRNNGLPNARSAVAAFLGKDSEHNAGGIFPGDLLNTSQKAELGAGMLALTVATKIKKVTMTDLSQVVIKTDSDYLAKAMTEWVFKWKKNGCRTAKGSPVTNRALFEWLDNSVRSLNEMGVRVLFWHVTRDRNREADRLANDFLDGKIERSV